MTAYAAGGDEGANAAQMPFIRNLASSDRKLREQSLAAIEAFLSARASSLTPVDAQKLWTGLFYAMYMTDRPRPQQALAASLAELLFCVLPPPQTSDNAKSKSKTKAKTAAGSGKKDAGCRAADVWLRAFWAVLSAQWPGIDALRLDKFLLLVRRVFAAHIRLARLYAFRLSSTSSSSSSSSPSSAMCAPSSADEEATPAGVVLDVLSSACFDIGEHNGVALGLRLHALDVWVDELEHEGALENTDDAPAAPAAFVARLGDIVDALRRECPVKSVRRRAEESHADSRLPWATPADEDEAMGDEGGDDDGDDDDGWGGIQD